jgi:hypothetical protein
VPGAGTGAPAGDDPIRGTQVGRTLAPAIEDDQLMPDQHGLGDNGTESTRPRQSGQGNHQMNETIAKSRIPAMVSTAQKPPHSRQFANSP